MRVSTDLTKPSPPAGTHPRSKLAIQGRSDFSVTIIEINPAQPVLLLLECFDGGASLSLPKDPLYSPRNWFFFTSPLSNAF